MTSEFYYVWCYVRSAVVYQQFNGGTVSYEYSSRLNNLHPVSEVEVQMVEGTAKINVPGLRQGQYVTLLGLEKAISSHRNIPDLFRDLACRLQDLFKFRDIGVMLPDESRNVM